CPNWLYVRPVSMMPSRRRWRNRIGNLNVGDGPEKGVAIGPNIDKKAVAKVKEHITDACAMGAQVVAGGEQHGRGGLFFTPPVPTAVAGDESRARRQFGLVAPPFRFRP
ncbi:aldehyde dehydrogenase family protein, partial [Mesorhizobium sp. M4B.F.Ca.ET.049.02.1.2]